MAIIIKQGVNLQRRWAFKDVDLNEVDITNGIIRFTVRKSAGSNSVILAEDSSEDGSNITKVNPNGGIAQMDIPAAITQALPKTADFWVYDVTLELPNLAIPENPTIYPIESGTATYVPNVVRP